MLDILIFSISFFNPSIHLKGGRKVNLQGSGPPILFSTGLFGTIPSFLYSNFKKELSKNCTLITIDDFRPVNRQLIESVSDELSVEKIGFLAHSSFDKNILESNRIQNAVLFDPMTIPKVGFMTLHQHEIHSQCPTLVIRSNKGYDVKSIPIYLEPNIPSEENSYSYVSSFDLFDDVWANLALNFGSSAVGISEEKKSFENWNFDKGTKKMNRKLYRKHVASVANTFILKKLNDGGITN